MTSSTRAGYRPDIDGLRAIAVTSVVAFHANVPGIRGGFVGVDIFFVISGYLITQLLLREATRLHTIDLAEFYARRIRRLFPALAVVVLATFLIAHFLLLPVAEQPGLARSGVWTAGYASNIYFKGAASDYFAGPVDQQPLLHTWSLAVEEQYYLVWPTIVLLVCWLARRRTIDLRMALLYALVPIAVGSFALCVRWTDTAASAAFYYLPARGWELGLGAILAVGLEGPRRPRPALGDGLLVIGLAFLAIAIVAIDRTTPFPGFAAMWPVVGAACCIAAGALGSRSAPHVLGNRLAVAIGKISYSWYLWHWPLLAIARARTLGETNLPRDLALASIALVLACITLFVVENPIRHDRPGPFARKGSTIVVGIAISGLIAGAALVLRWSAAREAAGPRFAELAAALAEQSPLHTRCHQEHLAPLADCTLPGADPTHELVVWGDSHAELVVAPVAAFGQAHGIPVVQRTSSACPPLLGVVPSDDDHRPNAACADFNAAVLAELRAHARSGKRVVAVLGGRWPNYLASVSPAGIPTRTLSSTDGATRGPAVELFETGLDKLVAELAALDIAVIVVATPPEFVLSPPQCRLRSPERCDVPRAAAESYRAAALSVLKRVIGRHPDHAALVDPFLAFCGDAVCSPTLDGKLAYQDPHHLTFHAAGLLRSYYDPALATATGTAR